MFNILSQKQFWFVTAVLYVDINFNPEDGGNVFLQNTGINLQEYMVSCV
jgi:hypothetical protein